MASTLTLQNSINFVTPILKNQPLMVSAMEPALTAGNLVLGTLLGAPMRWAFNRKSVNFAITAGGGTDYTQVINDFGFLETQWLKDATANIFQLGGAVSLAAESTAARPQKVARQYDDNTGNLVFRFDKIPDGNYTAYLDYQKKAPLMTSPASVWGLVPDEFQYIFNQGFLSFMMLLTNDSRFPIFENYFLARLLGAQDGLTDQERNIFVANWMALAGTLTRATAAVNSGAAGRGK